MPSSLILLIALAAPPSAEDLDFFEKRVRPLLVERCYECHSSQSEKLQGSLRLDSRAGALAGGDIGPAATPGDPEKSLLIEAVRYSSESIQMPPSGRLPPEEIAILEEWVRRGLPYPPDSGPAVTRAAIDIEAGRKHWAFLPVQSQPLPAPGETSRTRIDPFLDAARSTAGLAPSPPAPKAVLIRRAKFDLLGLPPTPEEIAEFEAESAPDAYERLIDRYLASPHHGERWGRYWLDLARYADIGESWREGEGQPWLYRDWVVAALNRDLPYDDFVRQQLAADLQPGARPADNAALGYLGLSPSYWKELKLDHTVIKQVVAEEWEERIEAIGGTFLGLTLACARCHDHKFDPVTQHDYYALAGVLASTKLEDRPLIDDGPAQAALAARSEVKSLEKRIDELSKMTEQTDALRAEIAAAKTKIEALRKTPHFDTPVACGVSESSIVVAPDGEHRTKIEYRPGEHQDVPIHIRGSAAKPGPVVPRRFISVLSPPNPPLFQQGSGRRELAEAIVTDAAPLAARVIVNRVWHHHFGRGLSTTPSNFGTHGDRPSHPELLDDLAARFIARGWSLKWLHREIAASAAYRQSSASDEARQAVDPENVWLWRMRPRRLSVEAWRDAMLAASGRLDASLGGPPAELSDPANRRRTIYGTVKRRELSDLLRLFDFPDPVTHSASREPTTTPLQQLFALNGPLLAAESESLRERLAAEARPGEAERVQWLYHTLYGRPPADEETSAARDFLAAATSSGTSADEAWRQYCHVLLTTSELLFID